MKRILFFIVSILVFLLWGCASTKRSTKSDIAISDVTDSTSVVQRKVKTFIDTTKMSATKIRITKIQFFDPARNAKEFADKPNEDESEEQKGKEIRPHPKKDRDPPPAIKSIEVTEIDHSNTDKGITKIDSTRNDSTTMKSDIDNKTKTDVKEDPVDPYKWRWISGIVVIMFFVGIWLKYQRK